MAGTSPSLLMQRTAGSSGRRRGGLEASNSASEAAKKLCCWLRKHTFGHSTIQRIFRSHSVVLGRCVLLTGTALSILFNCRYSRGDQTVIPSVAV